jgi:phospholipid/cholesterol/gamma-HCH transport system substrate-binding protein
MLETVINARYRNYQRAVGLLILATLGLLFVVLWTANRQLGLFSQTYVLYGFLDNVRGLARATPVTLAGLKIGEVRDLAITDYNRIRIELILDRKYQPRIREDSTAEVKADLLGNARLEINMGTPQQPMLADQATLAFQRSSDLDALLKQAQEQLAQIAAVLGNVRVITDELRQPDGPLLGTLRGFAQITAQLQPLLQNLTLMSAEMQQVATDLAAVSVRIREGQGTLGALTDRNSALSRDVASSVQKLRETLTGLEQLASQLPRYGRQVEQILRQTETLTTQLAKASGQAPALLDKSRGVAEDASEVVGGIKRSAVVRALSPPDPPRSLFDAPRDPGWLVAEPPP